MPDPDQSGNPVSTNVYFGRTLGWKTVYQDTVPPYGIALTKSRAVAEGALIPSDVDVVETQGYYTQGDGGGGIYNRVALEPSHAGKFQDLGGAWFELDVSSGVINPRQLGAVGDLVADDQPAFQSAWDLGTNVRSTLKVTPGQYGFGSSLVLTGAFFLRMIDCDAGAMLQPLVNNIAIVEIDVADTVAFNVFKGMQFFNDLNKTGCTGIEVTGNDLTKFMTNNLFSNCFFNGYVNGILWNRLADPLGPGIDWTNHSNCSFRSCDYGFRSVCGSGTGNIYNGGTSLCTIAGLFWYGGGSSVANVGDITISNIQFGVAATAIHLDPGAGYRANVSITSCQMDAGVTLAIYAENYGGIRLKSVNWGGGTTYSLINCENMDFDLRDTRSLNYSDINGSIASTTEYHICTVSVDTFNAVSLDVVTDGFIQGRSDGIRRSSILISRASGAVQALVTSISYLATGSAVITHTATVVGTDVEIKATFNATVPGSNLRNAVHATGYKFNLNPP